MNIRACPSSRSVGDPLSEENPLRESLRQGTVEATVNIPYSINFRRPRPILAPVSLAHLAQVLHQLPCGCKYAPPGL